MSATDYRHISILWASPEHAAEFADLHASLFDEPWDAAAFTTLLGHPGCTALLVKVGTPSVTAGFILGQLAADEAEILTLCVAKDRQRNGIGRRLVEALGRAVKKAEGTRLFLEVAEDNAAAVALYKRVGFQEVGRRTGYYVRPGSPARDALRLVLTL